MLSRLGIEVADRNFVEVWNKADLVDEETREHLEGDSRRSNPPAVLLSAVSGEGCEALLETIARLVDDAPPVSVYATPAQGAAVAWLYRHGRVLDRIEDDEGGVRLAVRLEPQALGQFEQLFPKVDLSSL